MNECCAVEGCDQLAKTRHWCRTHYMRWWATGDVAPDKPIGYYGASALKERFWAKVDRRGPDECWLWLRAKTADGYGRFKIGGKVRGAHRVAYELEIGPIPEGLTIDHFECDNPPCCNPAHMKPAPILDNVTRAHPGAYQARKTHCPQGHPYDEANTYRSPKGDRQCRTCKRA